MVQDVMQDKTRKDSKTVFTTVQHNSQLIASVRFYFSLRYLFFIYNKICYILSDMSNISDVNNLDIVDNSHVVIIGDF
jgi:hypothetical protein